MALPQGLHLDQAVVLGHDRFADRQSESKALLVDALILLLQLSKAFEELFDVAAVDASARVKDVHNQTLGHFVIGHADLNETFLCELKGVLDQVDQDLLQSDLVSHEPREGCRATTPEYASWSNCMNKSLTSRSLRSPCLFGECNYSLMLKRSLTPCNPACSLKMSSMDSTAAFGSNFSKVSSNLSFLKSL